MFLISQIKIVQHFIYQSLNHFFQIASARALLVLQKKRVLDYSAPVLKQRVDAILSHILRTKRFCFEKLKIQKNNKISFRNFVKELIFSALKQRLSGI